MTILLIALAVSAFGRAAYGLHVLLTSSQSLERERPGLAPGFAFLGCRFQIDPTTNAVDPITVGSAP